MKVVSPSGEVVEITGEEPELLQAARSSFGLLGIVVEATFRIGPLETLAVEHRLLKVSEFVAALPELIAEGSSPMWFLFPFSARSEGRVMVELRRYTGGSADLLPRDDLYWRLRNYIWATLAPAYNNAVTTAIPFKPLRHALAELGNRAIQVVWRSVRDRTTAPTSQIIRYPVGSGGFSKYTFCFAAFPEQEYGERLTEYFEWVRHYDRTHGYRPNMPAVCYRITHDQSSLLSYSWDGTVLTIDPASTGDPGWMDFVRAYNAFACDRGGIPLLNQTPQLEPQYMRRAFGDRLDRLEEIRRGIDPDERFLSGYFRKFLQPVGDEA
jgi:FAD/FMN-containing dehydrogenase